MSSLAEYRSVYRLLARYEPPPYSESQEHQKVCRKPVTSVRYLPRQEEDRRYLYARKVDGTFGFVHAYGDGRIRECWEGYVHRWRRVDPPLGDGLVYAAEKVQRDDVVVLLDVYRVRGAPTARRRTVLVDFLQGLKCPEGFVAQRYSPDPRDVCDPPLPGLPVDGFVAHDTRLDAVFKWKERHTIDLVYSKGHFLLPEELGGRIPCSEEDLRCRKKKPKDGHVYELDMETGRIVRRRRDRFTGNTAKQMEAIFACGAEWKGPPAEPIPPPVSEKEKKKAKEKCGKKGKGGGVAM